METHRDAGFACPGHPRADRIRPGDRKDADPASSLPPCATHSGRTVPAAAVRFVSAEPLLGPLPDLDLSGLHWLIAGAVRSGPRARPLHVAWVRDLRDQCAAGIPFFFKQWGGRTPKANSREPDGSYHDEIPVVARGRTNGSPSTVAAPAGVMSFEIIVRGFWVAI